MTALPSHRRATAAASFGGWAGDAFDVQLFSLALPLLLASWQLSPAMAGSIASASLAAAAVGGTLGGALSDSLGRVRLLLASVLLVSAATLACALAQVPWHLLVAKSIQGLGFGAEWSVGAVLMAEAAPPQRRGRYLGFMQSAWAVGGLGAVLVYVANTALWPPQSAWRLMFLFGIAPAGLVLWLRARLPQDLPSRAPARARPRRNRRLILRRVALTALIGLGAHGGYHSLFTWIPTLLRTWRNYPATWTGLVLVLMTAAFGVGCIAAGYMADRYGRRPAIAAFAAGSVLASALFSQVGDDPATALLLALPTGFCAGGTPAVLGTWFSELFPAGMRGAGVGFSYNGGRLAGALLPALIGWASARYPLDLLVAVVAAASYGLVLVLLPALPETRGHDLHGAFP